MDDSAHIRIESAVIICMRSTEPLYRRVEIAHKIISPILNKYWEPRQNNLLQSLRFDEMGGISYGPNGAMLNEVNRSIIKNWLGNLLKLYALSSFLRGTDPESSSFLSY